MKAVRCSNGHFFDHDVYVVCPHCGAEIGQGDAGPAGGREGYANWKKASQGSNPPSEPSAPVPETSARVREPSAHVPEPPAKVSAPQEPPAAPSPKESLAEALRQVSASDEGKTLSYFSLVSGAQTGEETAPAAKTAPAAEGTGSPSLGSPAAPVVGLMVGIAGPHLCEIFGIGSGSSSIGRGKGNSVVLNKDFAVSREKHAMLTYEPKSRQFYIKPGESSGLTYLNSAFVTELTLLKPRDIIEVGGSRFLFVPLCGEEFSWEDYLK